MKFAAGFATAILLAVLGIAALVSSGWYDVSAGRGMHPLLAWLLHTTMENSVRSRAAANPVPPDLQTLGAQGFQDFNEMCVGCHGAPGREPGEIGKGLAPKPPSLNDVAKLRSPAEIFWIVKNGVHMTGMPAFGPTHDDKRIWAIAAFVRSLPTLRAEQYDALQSDAAGAAEPRGHGKHEHR
jgi:mono/diheme cytochrome c family protein